MTLEEAIQIALKALDNVINPGAHYIEVEEAKAALSVLKSSKEDT